MKRTNPFADAFEHPERQAARQAIHGSSRDLPFGESNRTSKRMLYQIKEKLGNG